MKQLRKMKREAKESAERRGHKMGYFRRVGVSAWEADCKKCSLHVIVRPTDALAPNECDIAGPAVAVNCKED